MTATSSPRSLARPAEALDRVLVLEPPLRKPVNTLAIVPKTSRITCLGRKVYNVLLFKAQEQGLEKDVYRAPLEAIIRGVDFDSNDQALIKKHLSSMVSTTVEWHSPTTGEGSRWDVCGLLAHARILKVRGQNWVEWSYAVNLKQELLAPQVFARLSLGIISQLRTHAGLALYEICARYRDVGRTARQTWRWWYPVLSGHPLTEKSARLEYRFFKRDTLKPAIAEVNAITDLSIDLIEHKAGRFVDELQFSIQRKSQKSLPLTQSPAPVDLALSKRAMALGIGEEALDALIQEFGDAALQVGLDALEKRIALTYAEPLRDRFRYLRSMLPQYAATALARTEAIAVRAAVEQNTARETREEKWRELWLTERRAHLKDEFAALDENTQAQWSTRLAQDMATRRVHPSVLRRFEQSGWRHPMVIGEMIAYYAQGTYGERWDQPDAEALLAIAVTHGDT